jgi:hypothetical protein
MTVSTIGHHRIADKLDEGCIGLNRATRKAPIIW